jgi:hypothetical protein
MRDFFGDFETHLTVAAEGDPDRVRLIQAWADKHDAKYTRIVLDRGLVPDQPMLTVTGRGSLQEQSARARELVLRLHQDGFPVVRVKVEASPFNRDVPMTTAESTVLPGTYFEHHVKLVLADDMEVDQVRAVSERHRAHVSRNSRRIRADGRHERFVTQRCHGVGRIEARECLDALLADLETHAFVPIEVEQEFVLVDDNPQLDRGWIATDPS